MRFQLKPIELFQDGHVEPWLKGMA